MYITKTQQHEERQHAYKVNAMNVHNRNNLLTSFTTLNMGVLILYSS